MQYDEIDYYQDSINEDDIKNGCCLVCPDSKLGCMCSFCRCTKCFWYKSNHDGTGFCELAKIGKEKYKRISDKKAHNFVKCTNKSVLCQIDESSLIWVPLSAISKYNFVKQWFVDIWRLNE